MGSADRFVAADPGRDPRVRPLPTAPCLDPRGAADVGLARLPLLPPGAGIVCDRGPEPSCPRRRATALAGRAMEQSCPRECRLRLCTGRRRASGDCVGCVLSRDPLSPRFDASTVSLVCGRRLGGVSSLLWRSFWACPAATERPGVCSLHCLACVCVCFRAVERSAESRCYLTDLLC